MLTAENAQDWSESVSKIVAEAMTANRPRTLFGVQLGVAPKPAQATATVVKPPVVLQAAPPKPAPSKEKLSPLRVKAFQECYQIIREQLIGRGGKNHPWVLVFHSRDTEGAKGMLDSLETNLMRGGAAKMQKWLSQMSDTDDACVALSSVLASGAEVAPDRMVGILLLTTDVEGGSDVVGKVFSRLTVGVDSSLHLAHFLHTCSRDARSARGLVELLGTLTAPNGDNWKSVEQFAEMLCQLSSTVGGSRRLAEMLHNLSEVEDGSLMLARMLVRLSHTPEGAQATLKTLRNLSNDKEGATCLSRILSRASLSRPGASDIVKALQLMTAKSPGRRELTRLLVDLADGRETARFLANLVREPFNAYAVQFVFDQISQDGASKKLLGYALSLLANHPLQRAQYRIFEARLDSIDQEMAC